VNSRPVSEAVIKELAQAGCFHDREPTGDAQLMTDEWVLSAAAHAALERGYVVITRSVCQKPRK
jgi:hypothetical protein